MKVKLKFKIDEIVTISVLLNSYYELNFNGLTIEEKLQHSIGYLLSDIFETKKRALMKKSDLFNESKSIKMTLKYHEAWGLKNILVEQGYLLENDYQKINIQRAIHQLDSKK
ncbi:hypothetical protein [Tenacibaculum soleae]|uniref:hypothetical protein n=1 Tax=Tenacibaculum soleae TaxID=447689 RepID=UPI0023007BDB|nr:hypothetical protein [Tenacibaculum soleae]